MKLLCIDPLTSPYWSELITLHDSDLFHSPKWLRVLSETYGFRTGAYVVMDDEGHLRAGVPFCHISDMRGERVATLPFSDYCDPLLDSSDSWNLLSNALLEKQLPYTVRCLHSSIPLADPKLQMVKQANWHGVDLSVDLDVLWQRLHESARRAIRKAKREGVVVRNATSVSDLRNFFAMHLTTRKQKYHLLAQPYQFFEKIWEHFIAQDQGLLLIAEYQGAAIGATLFLEWKDKLYYKFNTSHLQQLLIRPNDLIMWEAMQYGKQKGFSTLDLGLSDWGQDGLVSFKSKYASNHKVIYFLNNQLDADKTSQNHVSTHPALQMQEMSLLFPKLTELFTDPSMPDALCEKAGNLLYRYFS